MEKRSSLFKSEALDRYTSCELLSWTIIVTIVFDVANRYFPPVALINKQQVVDWMSVLKSG